MGPIFGMGLGLGISDVELMKSSGKNLFVMVIISLTASFLYFMITPLSLSNPTELLARTNPTIYDVLIALFGGFAGILEQCRKDKGTVFSGVAIATALMPPLCTAGFSLASGNIGYFFGALYLFFINCLFIMLATYLSVKYFEFRQKEFKDIDTGRKTKRIVTLLIVLFIVPSIWSAVILIQQNNFEMNATAFAKHSKNYGKSIIYDYKIDHTDGSVVNLYFSGDPLTEQTRRDILAQAAEYNIKEEQVLINEYSTTAQDNNIELVKSIYDKMDTEVSRRDAEIVRLRQQLAASAKEELPYVQLAREIMGIYPSVRDVMLARGAMVSADSLVAVPSLSVIVHPDSTLSSTELTLLTEWLRVRLATDMEVVVIQP
jgi:uncharacterized hydrophobic protein (TIGR00271 family)